MKFWKACAPFRARAAARHSTSPLPVRPPIRTDNPAAGADHPRAEGGHRDVVRPAIGEQHRLMVTVPARHVERPHAELAHVAERHRGDRLVEAGHVGSHFESPDDEAWANTSSGRWPRTRSKTIRWRVVLCERMHRLRLVDEPYASPANLRRDVMQGSNGVICGIVVASFGFLTLAPAAAGEPLSSQQILDALTAAPKGPPPSNQLRTRSPSLDDHDTAVAGAKSMPHIDLEVNFEFDSVQITPEAEGQLRELGKALADPKLKGAAIAINGHTDAKGGDAFNKRLSERRAQSIKTYLVDNFGPTASNLRAVGYGKSRLKNTTDPFAPPSSLSPRRCFLGLIAGMISAQPSGNFPAVRQ
jgi:outer membrane protein OmpA-like peptidoglycan-associated protein